MKKKNRWLTFVFACLLISTACAQPAPPTQPPAAAVSSNDDVIGTPTGILELVAPSPEATEPPLVATAVPPTPEPSAPIASPAPTGLPARPAPVALTVLEPVPDLPVMTGTNLQVAGVVDPTTAVSVTVQLQAGPYRLIDTTVEVDADTGAWTAAIAIPHSVDGLGRLTAMSATETVMQDLQLVYDAAADDSGISLVLDRPGDGQFAVAGHPLFFEGSVTGAVSNTITIGIYTDDCTTFAARQSFTLTAADATWNGMVNLPEILNGRTCAFAYTGAPEQGMWREVQLWLPALHPDDEAALGTIMLGNASDTPFKAGEAAYLFGSAVGSDGEELLLTWMAEDGETVLAEETAVIDILGYWETELLLPDDAAGLTTLIVQLGEGDEATVLEQTLIVE